MRVKIEGARYWRGSGTKTERIYLITTPRTGIYYDLGKEEWISPLPVDMEKAVADVLSYYHVESIDGLRKALQP